MECAHRTIRVPAGPEGHLTARGGLIRQQTIRFVDVVLRLKCYVITTLLTLVFTVYRLHPLVSIRLQEIQLGTAVQQSRLL